MEQLLGLWPHLAGSARAMSDSACTSPLLVVAYIDFSALGMMFQLLLAAILGAGLWIRAHLKDVKGSLTSVFGKRKADHE